MTQEGLPGMPAKPTRVNFGGSGFQEFNAQPKLGREVTVTVKGHISKIGKAERSEEVEPFIVVNIDSLEIE